MSENDDNSECFSDEAPSNGGSHTSHDRSGSNDSSSSFSLVNQETQAVKRSKYLVIAILISAAALVGGLTYYLLSGEEKDDFEAQFHDFAVEIGELVHHEAANVFLSVEGLATTITSYTIATNSSWPFQTIPHFEMRGMQANELARSLLTAFSPLVYESTKKGWEAYSVKNQGWIQEGVEFNIELHEEFIEDGTFVADPISTEIFRYENGKEHVGENGAGPFLPVWQMAPAPHDDEIVNYNLLAHPVFDRVYHGMIHTMEPVLSEVFHVEFLYEGSIRDDVTHPHSFLLSPVYNDFKSDESYVEKDIVGFIISVLPWDNYFLNVLPDEIEGISVVLRDTCNETFTYVINGPEAVYVGEGDLHDHEYDHLLYSTPFAPFSHLEVSLTKEHCEFFLDIYPTDTLRNAHATNKPVIYTIVVMLVFLLTSVVFIMYDYLVQRRQEKVMATAKRSNAIVSSLFPGNVRDRLMKDAEEMDDHDKEKRKDRFGVAKTQLKSFLDEGAADESPGAFGSKPIADLFPSATVMFADIVGFTAWSSVREPSQVFQLLETLYHAFDEIARRRRVFKVETIGDCYVAVTGLPEPRVDHAVVMARFARDCLGKMNDMSKKLEVTLGPDTGDLCMRIGLNSGPVTAGVLRGEKSRFQLFGDTVNTAARMESNGERNRIHLSQETVDQLIKAGKTHWVTPRQNKIVAKGKGELQTYWLEMKLASGPSSMSGTSSSIEDVKDVPVIHAPPKPALPHKIDPVKELPEHDAEPEAPTPATTMTSSIAERIHEEGLTEDFKKPLLSDKVERLVSWNSDVMLRLLKQIVARRNAASKSDHHAQSTSSIDVLAVETQPGATVLDEVKEIITLPRFDAKAAKRQEDPRHVQLPHEVSSQLRDYVTIIATMYRDNPFHNFEHASHVTMSVVKLLSRIVAPDDVLDDNSEYFDKNLHDHTYGITSDPLTQFAVVLSALIHDVDHAGVPNAQLVKEQASIAAIYKNKSVAEQNSVDIAWDLLMDESFEDLRAVIFVTQAELKRFRSLVVNTVLATDIVDKELKVLRNARWDKAFHSKGPEEKDTRDDINRKATIVIEHLIQASDVAHTMQHWHIYRKWNERFFQEQLHAFQSGRAEKDPATFWYKGEIGFFDFYIIPLAKKLKDCGVFGVSSDEYLNYAMTNRKEWEDKGERVVSEMIAKYRGTRFSYVDDQVKLGEYEKRKNVFLSDD